MSKEDQIYTTNSEPIEVEIIRIASDGNVNVTPDKVNAISIILSDIKAETRKQTLVDVLHMVDSKYQIFKLDVAFVEIMNELKAKYGIEEKPKV